MSLSQISLVVDTVPDMPPAVVQARADEGEWSPALVKSESCAHESPVAKQVGLRHARSEEVVGPIRIRVLHVLILERGCRRRRVSVLRRSRSFGIVHSLDFAKLATHLLVPGRRPVLPLVLLQPVLGTVNGWRSARGRRHVFQRRGRFLPGAGSTGTAIPATERVSAVEPEYIFPAEIEHDQHQFNQQRQFNRPINCTKQMETVRQSTLLRMESARVQAVLLQTESVRIQVFMI